jgi:hypothetical protein
MSSHVSRAIALCCPDQIPLSPVPYPNPRTHMNSTSNDGPTNLALVPPQWHCSTGPAPRQHWAPVGAHYRRREEVGGQIPATTKLPCLLSDATHLRPLLWGGRRPAQTQLSAGDGRGKAFYLGIYYQPELEVMEGVGPSCLCYLVKL